MKIKLQCIKTYETIQPATKLVSENMLTGENWDSGINIPESRWTTEAGKIITTTKGNGKRMVSTGNWMFL